MRDVEDQGDRSKPAEGGRLRIRLSGAEDGHMTAANINGDSQLVNERLHTLGICGVWNGSPGVVWKYMYLIEFTGEE